MGGDVLKSFSWSSLLVIWSPRCCMSEMIKSLP